MHSPFPRHLGATTVVLLNLVLLAPPTWATRPSASSAPTPAADDVGKLRRAIKRADEAVTRGDDKAAVNELQSALRLARERAPLELSRLTVVNRVPEGLGMISPASGGRVFGPTLRLYAEVRNFATRPTERGHEVYLATDAAFYYADGELITRAQNIGEHRFFASTIHDVTFMVVELTARGLPPQPYQVELIVRDQISGKTARARTTFEVAGGDRSLKKGT